MFNAAKFIEQRPIWLILFISALGLEVSALFFQHVLGYEPCVKCIYTRLTVMGLMLSGLVGLINPKRLYLRILGYLGLLTSSIWGYKIAADHVVMQREMNPLFAICDSIPNFPAWFQPHVWFPEVFEVRGSCGEINWELFNLSMPEWMKIIFIIYLVSAIGVILLRLYMVRKL